MMKKMVNGEAVDMTPQEEEAFLAEQAANAARVHVPAVVTMRQARLALLKAGKLDQVAGVIAGMPSPQKEAAQIEWEYSQVVERHRPLVAVLAPALGLDAAATDQLFITAATL